MDSATILKQLENLQSISSSNGKIDLLKKYLEDETFLTVIEMALDETLHYNIQILPVKKKYIKGDIFEYLYYLSSKQGANKEEKKILSSMCKDEAERELITRIIKKDLRCGCSGKIVNKAIPGLIKLMPYMRCSNTAKLGRILYPAFVQNKEDGTFNNLFHWQQNVEYLSRNGNEFIFPEDSLKEEILDTFPLHSEEFVYMGEFRVFRDGKYLPRHTGNGLINKALKKNQSIDMFISREVHFICWDTVSAEDFWDGHCAIPYEERLARLSFLEKTNSNRIFLSKTIEVDSFEEAQIFAKGQIAIGEEGAVLKNKQYTWRSHTSRDAIKLKAGDIGDGNERECELNIIGWYFGKLGTKYEKCIGGLEFESEDKKLRVNAGSGLSDEQRGFLGFNEHGIPMIPAENFIQDLYEKLFMDQVATVRFNEVIQDKKGSLPRLFLPRFIEVRYDKNEADTLTYIMEL
jgi:ATP-dependent DNA ligase